VHSVVAREQRNRRRPPRDREDCDAFIRETGRSTNWIAPFAAGRTTGPFDRAGELGIERQRTMKIRNHAVVPLTQDAAIRGPRTAPLILLADDNQDVREMYAAALPYFGLRVETACDGREAITKTRALRPDAVVMDLSMPVLEGDQAALVLKADLRTRAIPIVALTADGFMGRAKALAEGFDGFCTKPCPPMELARLLLCVVQAAALAGLPSKESA
jgi:two-component system cell cycle response regulator DivK